jgi:hypothetical protein
MAGRKIPPVPRPIQIPAGSIVVEPRPTERAYPLQEIQYQILIQGEEIPIKKGEQYMGAGVLATAGYAIAGILYTIDWKDIVKTPVSLGFFILLVALCLAAVFRIISLHREIKRIQNILSTFAQLKLKIGNFFTGVSAPQ